MGVLFQMISGETFYSMSLSRIIKIGDVLEGEELISLSRDLFKNNGREEWVYGEPVGRNREIVDKWYDGKSNISLAKEYAISATRIGQIIARFHERVDMNRLDDPTILKARLVLLYRGKDYKRNQSIIRKFLDGESLDTLCEQYGLNIGNVKGLIHRFCFISDSTLTKDVRRLDQKGIDFLRRNKDRLLKADPTFQGTK